MSDAVRRILQLCPTPSKPEAEPELRLSDYGSHPPMVTVLSMRPEPLHVVFVVQVPGVGQDLIWRPGSRSIFVQEFRRFAEKLGWKHAPDVKPCECHIHWDTRGKGFYRAHWWLVNKGAK